MNDRDASSVPCRDVNLAEFLPVLREVLGGGGSFSLTVTGTSMYPTLLGGRDQVVLRQPAGPLRKGDLPLYRRDNGQFVLHRIIRVRKDGSCVCCGDHQWDKEPGIRPDQVIALAVSICRKGKTFSVGQWQYRLWVRFWVAILPLRRPIFRAAGFFSRLRRKLGSE